MTNENPTNNPVTKANANQENTNMTRPNKPTKNVHILTNQPLPIDEIKAGIAAYVAGGDAATRGEQVIAHGVLRYVAGSINYAAELPLEDAVTRLAGDKVNPATYFINTIVGELTTRSDIKGGAKVLNERADEQTRVAAIRRGVALAQSFITLAGTNPKPTPDAWYNAKAGVFEVRAELLLKDGDKLADPTVYAVKPDTLIPLDGKRRVAVARKNKNTGNVGIVDVVASATTLKAMAAERATGQGNGMLALIKAAKMLSKALSNVTGAELSADNVNAKAARAALSGAITVGIKKNDQMLQAARAMVELSNNEANKNATPNKPAATKSVSKKRA